MLDGGIIVNIITKNLRTKLSLPKPWPTPYHFKMCHNPSLGLATKARGLQGCGPRGRSEIHSTCSRECKECEGMNPHTPKWTPMLGVGVATLALGSRPRQKGLQGCGPNGSPGVTSGTPGSVGKCEGVNPHTPKATPALGDGVPVDSRNFRDRFEGSNLNGLWRSLYQWKALEA